ncbi:MAG TPA: hypothetical protein VNQ14_03020 [Woeseiaceae bacterium]|nr:hypothetical protein [Woeseiaceae bacterium]
MPNPFEILINHAVDGVDNRQPPRPIDFTGFLAEFRRFDWSNETNRTFWARKFSPEILVRSTESNVSLSVTSHDVLSAALDYREPNLDGFIDFVVILRNGQEGATAGALLLGFATPRQPEVEMAYRLFFAGSYKALDRHLSTLLPLDLIDESE